jgi:hypothetical protein
MSQAEQPHMQEPTLTTTVVVDPILLISSHRLYFYSLTSNPKRSRSSSVPLNDSLQSHRLNALITIAEEAEIVIPQLRSQTFPQKSTSRIQHQS